MIPSEIASAAVGKEGHAHLLTGRGFGQQLVAALGGGSGPGGEASRTVGDRVNLWSYGINQQSEVKSEADLIAHCKIVAATRRDLGLQWSGSDLGRVQLGDGTSDAEAAAQSDDERARALASAASTGSTIPMRVVAELARIVGTRK
jgi:hypothetical protein